MIKYSFSLHIKEFAKVQIFIHLAKQEFRYIYAVDITR